MYVLRGQKEKLVYWLTSSTRSYPIIINIDIKSISGESKFALEVNIFSI